MIKGVLFDLDGTLLDTARDLGNALNHVLNQKGYEGLSYEDYFLAASDGANKLLEVGFGDNWHKQDQQQCLSLFLEHYSENLAKDTVLFPTVEKLLRLLNKHKIPWGIVTNKPAYLTDAIIPQFSIFEHCDCVISGDTLPVKKPNPAPLLYAAGVLGVLPQNIVYLGDAERDIQSANAAHMLSAVAQYGYIDVATNTKHWYANYQCKKALDLINHFTF